MPDADGNFRGAFFRSESWLRVFGPQTQPPTSSNCEGPKGCSKCTPITFTPDWCLDGVVFTPECDCPKQ